MKTNLHKIPTAGCCFQLATPNILSAITRRKHKQNRIRQFVSTKLVPLVKIFCLFKILSRFVLREIGATALQNPHRFDLIFFSLVSLTSDSFFLPHFAFLHRFILIPHTLFTLFQDNRPSTTLFCSLRVLLILRARNTWLVFFFFFCLFKHNT